MINPLDSSPADDHRRRREILERTGMGLREDLDDLREELVDELESFESRLRELCCDLPAWLDLPVDSLRAPFKLQRPPTLEGTLIGPRAVAVVAADVEDFVVEWLEGDEIQAWKKRGDEDAVNRLFDDLDDLKTTLRASIDAADDLADDGPLQLEQILESIVFELETRRETDVEALESLIQDGELAPGRNARAEIADLWEDQRRRVDELQRVWDDLLNLHHEGISKTLEGIEELEELARRAREGALGAGLKADRAPEPDPEPDTEPDTDPDTEPEPEPDPDTAPDTDPEPDPERDSEPDTEPDPEPDPEPGVDTGPEPKTDVGAGGFSPGDPTPKAYQDSQVLEGLEGDEEPPGSETDPPAASPTEPENMGPTEPMIAGATDDEDVASDTTDDDQTPSDELGETVDLSADDAARVRDLDDRPSNTIPDSAASAEQPPTDESATDEVLTDDDAKTDTIDKIDESDKGPTLRAPPDDPELDEPAWTDSAPTPESRPDTAGDGPEEDRLRVRIFRRREDWRVVTPGEVAAGLALPGLVVALVVVTGLLSLVGAAPNPMTLVPGAFPASIGAMSLLVILPLVFGWRPMWRGTGFRFVRRDEVIEEVDLRVSPDDQLHFDRTCWPLDELGDTELLRFRSYDGTPGWHLAVDPPYHSPLRLVTSATDADYWAESEVPETDPPTDAWQMPPDEFHTLRDTIQA